MQLLQTQRVAELTGLSVRTLEKKRLDGGGPRFVKLGRSVRYELADVEEWIRQSRRTSTSDTGS